MIRKKIHINKRISIEKIENLISNNNIIFDQKKDTLRAIINTDNTNEYICNYFYKNHNLYNDFYSIIKIRQKNGYSNIIVSVKHKPFTLSWLVIFILILFNLTYLYTIIYYASNLENNSRLYLILLMLMYMTFPIFLKIYRIKKQYLVKIYKTIKNSIE